MSMLLAILDLTAACIAQTEICPPKGSTISGQINPMGGQVVVVPGRPMRALGAEFRAGTNVSVHVVPWHRSDGTRGSIVHVTGELAKASVVGGVRVAGTVTIGQVRGGRTTKPLLVTATDIKGGRITFGAGTIDLAPGMTVGGRVEIAGSRLEITSPQPLHALGLDFEPGTLRLEQRATEVAIGGMLARPQEIGGVLVTKSVRVQLGGKSPVFEEATLARATPLQALGLLDGEAPPGTIVRRTPATTLVGPGPFLVCGITLAPPATPGLVFQSEASSVMVRGTLVGADVDVGGVFMTGAVTLRFSTAAPCKRAGFQGVLSRPTTQRGLELAAGSAFMIGAHDGVPRVQGTLAKPAVVEGLPVSGPIVVNDVGGRLVIVNAVLAKSATFEAWDVPAGTKLQRFTGGWQFETPTGQAARAHTAYRGQTIDGVTLARRDDEGTSFSLALPQTVAGLAMSALRLDHASACVTGNAARDQRLGIFEIREGGNVTTCKGAVVAAQSPDGVPSLRVGRWYATHVLAGDPKAPPANEEDTPTGAAAGFWIQINSLCLPVASVRRPPPPRRWIFVDGNAAPVKRADLDELTTRAAKPGQPCR